MTSVDTRISTTERKAAIKSRILVSEAERRYGATFWATPSRWAQIALFLENEMRVLLGSEPRLKWELTGAWDAWERVRWARRGHRRPEWRLWWEVTLGPYRFSGDSVLVVRRDDTMLELWGRVKEFPQAALLEMKRSLKAQAGVVNELAAREFDALLARQTDKLHCSEHGGCGPQMECLTCIRVAHIWTP